MEQKKLKMVSDIINSNSVQNQEYRNQRDVSGSVVSTPARSTARNISTNQQFFTPRTQRVSFELNIDHILPKICHIKHK